MLCIVSMYCGFVRVDAHVVAVGLGVVVWSMGFRAAWSRECVVGVLCCVVVCRIVRVLCMALVMRLGVGVCCARVLCVVLVCVLGVCGLVKRLCGSWHTR